MRDDYTRLKHVSYVNGCTVSSFLLTEIPVLKQSSSSYTNYRCSLLMEMLSLCTDMGVYRHGRCTSHSVD